MDEWSILARNLQAQREQQEALDRYNAAQAAMQQAQNGVQEAQGAPLNPLESVLSGIGNSIKHVGQSIGSTLGGAATNNSLVAGIDALVNGKSYMQASRDAQKRQDDLVKSIYGTDDTKDAYTKNLGASVDAATAAADLIPGLGTGAKVAVNVGQGILSGVANPLAEKGSQATLEDAMQGALIGGASAGVGQAVGGKLAGKAAGNNVLSKAVGSNIGRGAITGAASGATGGGLSAALNGGDVLSGALQGAGGGALAGGTMAGAMGLVGTGLDKAKTKLGITEPAQVVEQPMQNGEVQGENSNMIGRALKNAGNDLEAAQTNITRAERRKYGIKDAGEVVDNLRKRTGFSNVDDQATFAKNITGGPDSVMDTIQKYNISVDEKGNPITLRTDQYEVAINDAVGKDWKKSVMGESYDQFRKDLVSDIQNEDPITAANWLKREAATQRGIADAKGPTADKAARKAKIYTEVANKIDDLSYSAVPQKNVNRMFDDTIDEFNTRAQEARAAGNKKYAAAYEKLAKELQGTERTIANYRTFKKDFVKSAQLAEISRGAQSGSLEAGYKRGNVVGRLVNTITEEPVNRLLAAGGGVLNDLGDAVNGVNTSAVGKVAGKAGDLVSALNNASLDNITTRQIARQAGLGTDRALRNQANLQDAQQQLQDAETQQDATLNQVQQANNNLAALQQQQLSPAQQKLGVIEKAMDLALNAGDIKSYSELASLYQQAYKIYSPQEPQTEKKETKLTDNQAKALTGLQQLEQLAQMTPTAATTLKKTPLGGLVDMTGGDEYSNQAQSLALTLGYLQSGANVSENEAMRIGTSYIPNAFDNEATRQGKLARAKALLNNYLSGTQYYQQ